MPNPAVNKSVKIRATKKAFFIAVDINEPFGVQVKLRVKRNEKFVGGAVTENRLNYGSIQLALGMILNDSRVHNLEKPIAEAPSFP